MKHFSYGLIILSAAVLILSAMSLLVGGGHITVAQSFNYWQSIILDTPIPSDADDFLKIQMVMDSLRLPRTLAAITVGLCLSLSGTLLQTVTRNPLAETGLLGINDGAALGVVVGITFFLTETALAYLTWALLGASLSCFGILALAHTRIPPTPLRLVLAGLALGTTFKGATSYLLMSQQSSFDQYRFWVLGSLAGIDIHMLISLLPLVLLGCVVSLCLIKPLSALILGDDVARSLGYRPQLIRTGVTISVSLLTAAAVALAGPIAFLGLLAPHLARSLTGPNLFQQICVSSLIGIVLLLSGDILARVIIRPFDTPVSVIIACLGAPLLIAMIRQQQTFKRLIQP